MADVITPRRNPRKAITMAAQCRTISGVRDDGYLSDISAEGCCITTRGILFMEGSRVLIKPQGLEGLSGVIRWIDGHRAGVQDVAAIAVQGLVEVGQPGRRRSLHPGGRRAGRRPGPACQDRRRPLHRR